MWKIVWVFQQLANKNSSLFLVFVFLLLMGSEFERKHPTFRKLPTVLRAIHMDTSYFLSSDYSRVVLLVSSGTNDNVRRWHFVSRPK